MEFPARINEHAVCFTSFLQAMLMSEASRWAEAVREGLNIIDPINGSHPCPFFAVGNTVQEDELSW